MHWQDVLKATCGLGVLWVVLEWSKALMTMMSPKVEGIEKRTQVVIHLVRSSALSGALCIAVWILSLGVFVTRSSALAASLLFGFTVLALGVYLAVIYGRVMLRRRS